MTFELRVDGEPVAEAARLGDALYAAGVLAVEYGAMVQTFDVDRGVRVANTWQLEDDTVGHELSQGTSKFYEGRGSL